MPLVFTLMVVMHVYHVMLDVIYAQVLYVLNAVKVITEMVILHVLNAHSHV